MDFVYIALVGLKSEIVAAFPGARRLEFVTLVYLELSVSLLAGHRTEFELRNVDGHEVADVVLDAVRGEKDAEDVLGLPKMRR